MGNTFEVLVWVKQFDDLYGYDEFYRGESLIAAIWNFFKAKRQGHGCVTIHWR